VEILGIDILPTMARYALLGISLLDLARTRARLLLIAFFFFFIPVIKYQNVLKVFARSRKCYQ